MKRVVLVDMAGGLGNQIFLFQAAKFIASVNDNVTLVNMSNLDKYHSKGRSSIDEFLFPKTVKFFSLPSTFNKIYILIRNFLKKYNDCKQSLVFILDESYASLDRGEIYRLIKKKNPLLIVISGFWQNFEYWDCNFQYKLKSEGKKFTELCNEIKVKDPVLFHYRLGRLNNRWEHAWGALSPIFLSRALAVLNKNEYELKMVWIFSNDLPEARKLTESLVRLPYQFIYIDDSGLSPAELLVLFSMSKTLICSNSTFSILAAKIGNVASVVVPSELSKNGHKTVELPNEWNKVRSIWLN